MLGEPSVKFLGVNSLWFTYTCHADNLCIVGVSDYQQFVARHIHWLRRGDSGLCSISYEIAVEHVETLHILLKQKARTG